MSTLSARRVAFENSLRLKAAPAKKVVANTAPSGIVTSVTSSSITPVSGEPEPQAVGTEEVTWTSQDSRELEQAVAEARQGLLFVGVKA